MYGSAPVPSPTEPNGAAVEQLTGPSAAAQSKPYLIKFLIEGSLTYS
jgi:hypothetical protein